MAETPQAVITEVMPPSQAIDLYSRAMSDPERERILNTQVVHVNPSGIARRESYDSVMALISGEVDPKAPPYMSNVVSDLSGENLLAIANAHFYAEGPRTAQFSQLAERIHSLGSRSQEAGSTKAPTSLGMEYVLREIGERLVDKDLGFEDRRNLIQTIDTGMTPELMEHILTHQPELERVLVDNREEFHNEALVDILKKRSQLEETVSKTPQPDVEPPDEQ